MWKSSYPESSLFELVHNRELLKSCSNSLAQIHIWSLLGILQPRVICKMTHCVKNAKRMFCNLSKLSSHLHNLNDGLCNRSSRPLSVMSPCNNSIKEFSTLAELHDKMNSIVIFVSILQAHNIKMRRHMPHNLNLPPHILNINSSPKLQLRDTLASELLSRLLISAEICYPKLTSSELDTELIAASDVATSGLFENDELRTARVRRSIVLNRERVWLLPLLLLRLVLLLQRINRRRTAITHFLWLAGLFARVLIFGQRSDFFPKVSKTKIQIDERCDLWKIEEEIFPYRRTSTKLGGNERKGRKEQAKQETSERNPSATPSLSGAVSLSLSPISSGPEDLVRFLSYELIAIGPLVVPAVMMRRGLTEGWKWLLEWITGERAGTPCTTQRRIRAQDWVEYVLCLHQEGEKEFQVLYITRRVKGFQVLCRTGGGGRDFVRTYSPSCRAKGESLKV
ncbi:hypothetical protein IEQ34_020398 [Dendrobium chrysotoxum]|uniref:Uncharacterized protein n=1 Tax=Dendrobium chrysotoxum TaxID=161865 RepID=A0AAV7G0U3_DENCH|nr:hypothetical protein IEQ34_020398 [Dendrobium chrysotoxum]